MRNDLYTAAIFVKTIRQIATYVLPGYDICIRAFYTQAENLDNTTETALLTVLTPTTTTSYCLLPVRYPCSTRLWCAMATRNRELIKKLIIYKKLRRRVVWVSYVHACRGRSTMKIQISAKEKKWKVGENQKRVGRKITACVHVARTPSRHYHLSWGGGQRKYEKIKIST